jgi:tRNA pseudouridine55 synthase
MMNGILNINKPAGWTSHDVVQKVRGILGEKRVGHTGTLDPMATGVLVLCVGKATRVAQYLEAGEKEYRAVMRLGIVTDTQDAEGRILERRSYSAPDAETLRDVMHRFTGTIVQQPPIFSAVKVSGVPSYKLARRGNAIPLKPRQVTLFSIALSGYSDPFVSYNVRCSKGVYIRTLCADMGDALGTGAHLTSLVRARSGSFRLERAFSLEQIAGLAGSGSLEKALISTDDALDEFPVVTLHGASHVGRIVHGNAVEMQEDVQAPDGTLVRLHDPAGRLLSIARVHARMLRPELVFLNE